MFDALALEFADARFTWVDIEAQCELIDDFDVETFPALLIGQGPTLRFAGPLRPQPETLARLLRALLVSAAVVVQDAQAQALWLRLRHAD